MHRELFEICLLRTENREEIPNLLGTCENDNHVQQNQRHLLLLLDATALMSHDLGRVVEGLRLSWRAVRLVKYKAAGLQCKDRVQGFLCCRAIGLRFESFLVWN